MLLAALGSVHIEKTVTSGLGLRPRAAAFQAQFFTIWTSPPANTIYIFSPSFNIFYLFLGDATFFFTQNAHSYINKNVSIKGKHNKNRD